MPTPSPAPNVASTPLTPEFTAGVVKTNTEIFDEPPVNSEPTEEVKEEPKQTEPKVEPVNELKTEPQDKIEQAIQAGFKSLQQPKVEPKVELEKLTPEQEDALFNRFKPDDSLLQALDSDDKTVRLQGINNLINGVVKQSLTMAKLLMDDHMETLRGEFNPLKENFKTNSVEKGREEFFTKFPALKDDKYTEFLGLSTAELKKENFQPKSTEEALFTLAQRTEARIKRFDPNFKLDVGQGTQTTTQATSTMPKQPVISAGGGGGAGNHTSNKGKTNNRTSGVEVFD